MAQKKFAIILVRREWMNSGVHNLVNEGKPSDSTATHMIVAPLDGDTSDPHGVWLNEITSHQLTTDGSAVTMRFMVPWSEIIALGIFEEGDAKVKHGFQAASALGKTAT
jgi:hypothetical protein